MAGSIIKINPDVMSEMMAGTKTGNEFEDMIALNNIAIKASGNIDELTFELKKKLAKKLKETQLLYAQSKEAYETLAKEMGTSNIDEFKQKIKDYESTNKKVAEDSNKAKAELVKILKTMQSQKLMFTGAKGNSDIDALTEMMESEEKFYILYNKRFNTIKPNKTIYKA
jgi:ABC-type nitrate/sulfonate/bicarbonate transport system substrate-binding protein